MKIAVFTKKTTFHQGYGGLETQNKVLCEGLVQKGHDITVFSPKWELSLEKSEENGVNYIFVDCVYRMGPIFGFFGTKQKNNWINRSVEDFEEIHHKGRFDIVLAQSSAGLGVIKKKDKLEVKAVSISHGSIVGEYKTFLASMELPQDLLLLVKNTGFTVKNFFRRQRDFVHGSNKIIAVSNFVKSSIMEETFVDEKKVVVIHNGVDPQDYFAKDDMVKRGKKALYVGQIIKSKGINDLMEIFSDDDLKNTAIDLAGTGEMLETCQAKVKSNEKFAGRVNFLGKINYQELKSKYYMNPDYGVFVLPTKRYEGLPMVLVEAMFSGLPIVAYDMGGVADAVHDGKNGFLIKPGDVSDFKNKIMEIINNDKLKEEMSQNSLKLAYDQFTSRQMIDSYEKVMQEVLK